MFWVGIIDQSLIYTEAHTMPSSEFVRCGDVEEYVDEFNLTHVDNGAALDYLCPKNWSDHLVAGRFEI